MKRHHGYIAMKSSTHLMCAFGQLPGITGPAHQTVKFAHAIGRMTAMSRNTAHFRLPLNHMDIARTSRT
ncbi:MAG TPA: hypothetical protein DCL95_00875, partial [Rhodospirillaceae bacterium]|nr:hypothetical protein [Rhodospirillaceae bacterium]